MRRASVYSWASLRRRTQKCGADTLDRELLLNSAQLCRNTRHSIDDTGRLILANGHSPGLTHGQKACCPITSHSGENGTDGQTGACGGNRTKKDID
jgi:hypothetical protein